jgi:transcription initiation factor TFIIH subunit 1
MHAVATRLQREAESWCSVSRPQPTALVNPAAAVSALGELTPGGALMKGFEEESLAREYWNESTPTQIYYKSKNPD